MVSQFKRIGRKWLEVITWFNDTWFKTRRSRRLLHRTKSCLENFFSHFTRCEEQVEHFPASPYKSFSRTRVILGGWRIVFPLFMYKKGEFEIIPLSSAQKKLFLCAKNICWTVSDDY